MRVLGLPSVSVSLRALLITSSPTLSLPFSLPRQPALSRRHPPFSALPPLSPIIARDASGASSIFPCRFSSSIPTTLRGATRGASVSAMSTESGAQEASKKPRVSAMGDVEDVGKEREGARVSAVEAEVKGGEREKEEKKGGDAVEFALSPSCSMKILKGDITQWSIDGSSDAIVNAANERMLGGGGVDGAVHRAAGPELKEACYKVPEVSQGVRCPTGEARVTPGFRLPASHVIHTVGPIYDEDENPAELLKNAYRNTLLTAKENNIQYIAFPAISCGIYGYPFNEAASVAVSTVKEFSGDLKEVHFVLFSDDIFKVWLEKANELLGE